MTMRVSERPSVISDIGLGSVSRRQPFDPMLAMYVAARDASGGPVLVLEVVMPGDRHELEDAYQVG